MLDQNATLERTSGFLRRLAKDRSGNTLALIAAAIVPLLGLVGSGIDMGRAYLASSRLQAACDAGVLAARKELGTQSAVTGTISSDVAAVGQRFFNLNFRDGNYGSENRQFTMTLEDDFAITGDAKVIVPTSVMTIFGFNEVPITVNCQALLDVNDLDVMMVLDVTGSMRHSNSDDAASRIDSLKSVIRTFHAQLESAKSPDSRIRYGFVPYATNVNVGHLLEDNWVTNNWTYQSREDIGSNQSLEYRTTFGNWQNTGGTRGDWVDASSYPATYVEGTPPVGGQTDTTPAGPNGYYACRNALPIPTYTRNETINRTEATQVTDPDGTRTVEYRTRVENGTDYRVLISGQTCTVQTRTHANFTNDYELIVSPAYRGDANYAYRPIEYDVSNWRAENTGCIEERATYPITDYANVDLSRALDLDIDTVPTPGNVDTQWRPSNPDVIYARSFNNSGTGSFTPETVTTTAQFAATGSWWFSDCPARAQKLQEMDEDEINAYLGTLAPYGATYHDIGMIWGARLISPSGLFASENANVDGQERARHLIFLTDGQTEAYDLAYGAYGVEGLDERRWSPTSTISLAETVEARFGVACTEAKKRNVTVWVIAFGTYLNQSMLDCAGNGQYFEADNAEQLNDAFTAIAKSIGDLRISK